MNISEKTSLLFEILPRLDILAKTNIRYRILPCFLTYVYAHYRRLNLIHINNPSIYEIKI